MRPLLLKAKAETGSTVHIEGADRLNYGKRKPEDQWFRDLVGKHSGYAHRVAARLLDNHDDCEDIVQEAFIRVWRHRKRVDPDRPFSTYLYRIVVNLCLDVIKSRSRKSAQHTGDNALAVIPAPERHSPERISQSAQMKNIVMRLVRDLKPRQQAVFILRDCENLSVRDVSRILQISESSVKTNLYYARRFIRERILQIEEE